MLWHYGWGGPAPETWPVDVLASITHVTLAMCQSAATNTGRITDPPSVTRGQVAALVAARVGVTLGIGGSNDGGITVNSSARSSEMVASVLAIRERLGITGITWDIESAPGARWTVAALAEASAALIAQGLTVAIWSALYGGRLAAWGALAKELGTGLGWWERGFYDFPEAADSRLAGIVTGDIDRMRPYVARDGQIVASFAPVGDTSRTPPAVAAAAYAAARAARPSVGWSVWEDRHEAATRWATTRALAKI